MSEAVLYVLVAGIYGLLGACLSAAYYFAPRLRTEPLFHLLTAIVLLLAGLVAVLVSSIDFESLAAYHKGAQFFLFFGASLLYVPVIVYLLLHYWDLLLERITSPGSSKEPPQGPLTQKEEWQRIQSCLEVLALDPTSASAHERLGDLYSSMGFLDSAVYQYHKAADWLDTGYAQSHVLYKAARIQVERKKDIAAALVVLRRIVRVYPRSFFASYSRRVINHYEAHNAAPERSAPREGEKPEEPHDFFFPPGEE